VATEFAREHRGGDFSPIEPTTGGGPDYGRFVEAVRTVQDHARAADAPDEVITKAADLLETVSKLLSPYDADEWSSPAGRRMDLPSRGSVPISLEMICSMTSSAPPPIEARRESRKARAVGDSQR